MVREDQMSGFWNMDIERSKIDMGFFGLKVER